MKKLAIFILSLTLVIGITILSFHFGYRLGCNLTYKELNYSNIPDSYWKTNKATLDVDHAYASISTNDYATNSFRETLSNAMVKEEYDKWYKKFNTIDWVGHPMVSDNAPYTPSEGWLSNVEIGLRADGTVVWRKISK